MADYNTKIIEEFRANEGKVGGNFEGAPLLLLHSRGAKSGEERVNPMMYLEEDGVLYVIASKGGHPSHPDWYRNVAATPEVTVEVGTETFSGIAFETDRSERDRLYGIQASRYPGFAEYEQKTDRVIPVIGIRRAE